MLDPNTRHYRSTRLESHRNLSIAATMVSRLHSKTFPAMSSMVQEKENYEELNQIGNGEIHMVKSN